jgi:hypothetical protein
MPKNLKGGKGAKKRGNEDSFRSQRGSLQIQRYLESLRDGTAEQKQLTIGKVVKLNGSNACVYSNGYEQNGISISGNVKKGKPRLQDNHIVLLEDGQIIAIVDRKWISDIENAMGSSFDPRIKYVETDGIPGGGGGFDFAESSEDEFDVDGI